MRRPIACQCVSLAFLLGRYTTNWWDFADVAEENLWLRSPSGVTEIKRAGEGKLCSQTHAEVPFPFLARALRPEAPHPEDQGPRSHVGRCQEMRRLQLIRVLEGT